MTTRKIRELNKILRNNSNPALSNLADASFFERRSGLKDRRKLQTFIMNDRRSGIADRRKNSALKFFSGFLQRFQISPIGTFGILKNLRHSILITDSQN